MKRKLAALFATVLTLSSCGTITKHTAKLSGGESYPHAISRDSQLLYRPATADLSQYKSVQDTSARPHQRPDITVLLAASGGGYRAANLTAGVMVGLEDTHMPQLKGNLLQEIDYFSTVSGGGFPVGLYLSQLYVHQSSDFSLKNFMLKKPYTGSKALRKDYSDYMFFGYRRSLHLEEHLGKDLLAVAPNRELMLGDIFVSKMDSQHRAQLPMWFANASIFQNMNIFPFAPNVLSAYQVTGYMHNMKHYVLHHSSNPSLYGADMPAAVGMTASATFPYAVAATTLWSSACDETCYLQLFDGGLADNLGIFTAFNILKQDHNKIKILIVSDAYRDDLQPFSKKRERPRKFDLLHKIGNSGLESLRNHVKDNITAVAKSLLCTRGTTNVLVAYLDVDKYPEVKRIKASLWIDEASQKHLLDVGQQLVRNNRVLNIDLPRLLAGDSSVGRC